MRYPLFALLLAASLWSCTSDTSPSETPPEASEMGKTVQDNTATEAPEKTVDPTTANQRLSVLTISNEAGFLGMQPGDAIADHLDKLEAGTLQTGEGDFEVYYIVYQGEKYGYTMPDMRDESKMGDLTFDHPKLVTTDNVRIGTTYAQLRSSLGDLEVHGSEVESRTYAQKNGIYYRLDEPHNTYDLDPDDIKGTAKVIEISLSGNDQ